MVEQFDVFAVSSTGEIDKVVVLSGEQYTRLPTVVIVPLVRRPSTSDMPIHAKVEFQGQSMTARFELLASLPSSILVRKLGSLANFEYKLKNALDRLLAGY